MVQLVELDEQEIGKTQMILRFPELTETENFITHLERDTISQEHDQHAQIFFY